MLLRLRLVDVWSDLRIGYIDSGDAQERLIPINDKIWTPSIKFKREIKRESESRALFVADKSHRILRITEVTVLIGCSFDYSWFPWDWQQCSIELYTDLSLDSSIVLQAGEFTFSSKIDMPEFIIIDDSFKTTRDEDSVLGITKSSVEANIVIQRRIEYYVRFVFIPAMMIVGVSYCSFYIDYEAVPARTMLGVIPILTSFT
jgi:gamma-aminobutyric acid receptor subunit rho